MELIEFLDEFFSDSNQTFSLGIDLKRIYMFQKSFADIAEKYETYIENQKKNFELGSISYLMFNSKKLKDTFIPAWISAIIYLNNLVRDPQFENFIKESAIRLLEKYEEVLLLLPYFDESCYNYLNTLFDQTFKRKTHQKTKRINRIDICKLWVFSIVQ